MMNICKTLFLISVCVVILASSVFAVYIPVKGDPNDYIDISGHWAKTSIDYVIKNGYFKGITDKKFEPNSDMSRAMLVTVLWRLTGDDLKTTRTVNGVLKTYPKYVNMFWDMKDDAWYTDYVSWANENEIISGYSKREFKPDESITREQLSTILYNYLKNYKLVRNFDDLKVKEGVIFGDDSLISDWAKDKVYLIQQTGLMEGRTDGSFYPKDKVTRAEVSVVIERLVDIINGRKSF